MKLCFATYASVLCICKKPRCNNTRFVSTLISSVDPKHGDELSTDSVTVSNYVRGTKNISPRVEVYTKTKKAGEITEYFKDHVVPLLDQNKCRNCVLALKDIVFSDSEIEDSTIVEFASHMSKRQLMEQTVFNLEKFLAGLFLYVMVNTKNKGNNDVKLITADYISSFDSKKNSIHFENEDGRTVIPQQSAVPDHKTIFDEETAEKARLFCFDHENDLHMLPLCEMAAVLNPKHRHVNPLINGFLRQNKKTQNAILISESIKPYEHCSKDEIDKCVDAFEKEIEEKGFATIPFLYDGAKYLHKAFTNHADYTPDVVDPYVFKRHYVSLFPAMPGNLRAYIDDYEYVLEHHLECKMKPPLDELWYAFDLSYCDERIVVFWVTRFIITVCHYLHGFDPDAQYGETWHYKDTIEEDNLKTMEDMYYYALLLLYMSYGPEIDLR